MRTLTWAIVGSTENELPNSHDRHMPAIRVFAPALSRLRPALRLADSARPVVGLQGRRVARAAARGRRAAPRQFPAPAQLGRPGGPRRADPAHASTAADAPADHPRNRP